MCLWGWAEKVSREGKSKPSCPELGWLVGGWGGRWARLKTREKNVNLIRLKVIGLGLPWWLGGKESFCQCRRHRFNSWSMKIPHATEPLSPRSTATGPVTWTLGATATEAYAAESEGSPARGAATMSSPRSATSQLALVCHNWRRAWGATKIQHSQK